jgi:hypothetical protein
MKNIQKLKMVLILSALASTSVFANLTYHLKISNSSASVVTAKLGYHTGIHYVSNFNVTIGSGEEKDIKFTANKGIYSSDFTEDLYIAGKLIGSCDADLGARSHSFKLKNCTTQALHAMTYKIGGVSGGNIGQMYLAHVQHT